MDNFGLSKNDKYFDIHGRELHPVFLGPECNEEVMFPLSELGETGVAIYNGSQYSKLATMDKNFDTDFVDYMLECAKKYMMSNKIAFSKDQIMHSIENSKRILLGQKTVEYEETIFSFGNRNRFVKTGTDDEIRIQVTKAPEAKKQKSPNRKKYPLKHVTSPSVAKPVKKLEQTLENVKSLENEQTAKPFVNGKRFSAGKPENVYKFQDQQKQRFSYNADGLEHDVMVTQIDKRNCVWVRDKANNDIFESIHVKVNEEAKYQKVPPKPWIMMDKVYMAEDEGCWFRCKIMKFKPLTVFFLEYGNVAEVREIREVSDELAKIPAMAVRITFKESEYDPQLEDEIRIKSIMKNADGTFFVNVLEKKTKSESNDSVNKIDNGRSRNFGSSNSRHFDKQTEKTSDLSYNRRQKTSEVGSSKKPTTANFEKTFFKKPPYLCAVQNDQKIAVVSIRDNKLFLRTRECFEKLKQVEKDIEEYAKTASSAQNVKPNQLVLYQNNFGKFCRAIVNKVSGYCAEIELLDYAQIVSVETNNLKNINEELSIVPITCFPGGPLADFVHEPLDEHSKQIIEEHIKKRTKFSVVVGFDDELDLFDGTKLLSEQLQKTELNGRVFLKDIVTYKPPNGLKSYYCGCYKSSDHFVLVPSEELQEHMDYVMRSTTDDNEPYEPMLQEVCLGLFDEQWYRCLVTRIFDKECEVFFLDFGNVELIKKEFFRKADDQITKVPALALPCKLLDVPDHPDLENFLKKKILENEIYTADVKSVNEGKCLVQLPAVYDAIRKNLS